MDYFLKFPEIAKLTQTKRQHVITPLKCIFARHGILDKVASDNGRQFASGQISNVRDNWASKTLNFKSEISSVQWPKTSERPTQTIKILLMMLQENQRDPYIALLEYRNTPLGEVKLSPAQLLMSHKLKARLPTMNNLLQS